MPRKNTALETKQKTMAGCFAYLMGVILTLLALKSISNPLITTIGTLLEESGYIEKAWGLDACPSEDSRLNDRIYVVTGANNGLGFASVKALSLSSPSKTKVILGCRNHQKCLNAASKIDDARKSLCFPNNPNDFVSNVFVPPASLDLARASTIEPWVSSLNVPYVSHLLLNAGVMAAPRIPMAPETRQDMQFQVNHLSHYSLTSHLLPLIKAAPVSVGRIISTVASLAALFPHSYDISDPSFVRGRAFDTLVAYGQSKRANLLFARHMQINLDKYGIKSTASHPGYSRTNLFETEGSFMFLPNSMLWIKKFVAELTIVSMSSDDGAKMQLRALLDSTVPNGGYVVPLYGIFGKPIIEKSGTAIMDGYGAYLPVGYGENVRWTDKDVEELVNYSAAVMGRVVE